MAGAKETPRQKLISLMYLVLLAMLALQVSSAVIFKFEQLNKNLELSNANTEVYNKAKLANIKSEVQSRENPGQQLAYLNKAELLRAHTDELKTYLTDLKAELVNKTGGYDEEGNLKGAKEETDVEVYMIGPNKNGKAYEMKSKLDAHVTWLNSMGLGNFEPFAFDGKEHPLLKSKKDQKNKDFANLNFAASPLVASLATISELEGTVLKMERRALDALADSINVQDYKVKGLTPVVRTTSNYVVAGQPYTAEMFLTAQLATETPSMKWGEKDLAVDNKGIGTLAFTATSNTYDAQGLAKKTWTGQITVKKPNGQDTTYVVEQAYTVIKPTLKIGRTTAPTLYRNCGNPLNVAVPQLGANFNPKYAVTGGQLKQGQGEKITVIPTGREMVVSVSSDGVFVGKEKFDVYPVPDPFLELYKAGRAVDPVKGIDLGDLSRLEIRVIPEPNFKIQLPHEANYGGIQWKASLVRNGQERAVHQGTGARANLRNAFSEARAGDMIVIEITQLQRKNYLGAREEVKMPLTRRVLKVQIN